MAGATNRALKAAGVPKASIKTIRVKAGGRLSLKSALGVAVEHGLDTGKAHEHLARRDAKADAKRQATEASAAAARKAALATARPSMVRSLGSTSRGMMESRRADSPTINGNHPELLRRPPGKQPSVYTNEMQDAARKAFRAARDELTPKGATAMQRLQSVNESRLVTLGMRNLRAMKLDKDTAQGALWLAHQHAGDMARNNASSAPRGSVAGAARPTPASGDIRANVRANREMNRTAMSGYGRVAPHLLAAGREKTAAAAAAIRAAGSAPAGKAHVMLNGDLATVAPTKRVGHFFAYEQGGKAHIAHDATGGSIGTYSSPAAAHKALDGMRKTGEKLHAGILRGDEKMLRLGARYQRATQREGAAAPPKVAAAPAATPRPAPQPRTAKPAPASPKVAAARTPAAPSPAARAVYQRSEAGAAAATGAMRKDIRAMVKDVRGHREHLENLNDTRKALDRRKKLKAQQVMVREVITEIRAKLANSERALAGALAKRGQVASARATQSRLERAGQQRLF